MKKILIALAIIGALVAGFVATTTFGAHAAPANALSRHHVSQASRAALASALIAEAQHRSHHKLTVSPNPALENTNGEVSFSIQATGLIPLQSYFIDAPNLNFACGNSLNLPVDVTADFAGRINVAEHGSGCVTGKYVITAQDDNTPFTSYTATLTIKLFR